MKTIKLQIIITCLLLTFLISCGTKKQIKTVKIPEDFAGMVHAGHTKTAEEYEFIDEMGISWILTTFNWSSVEKQQGVWDFSSYDAYVEAAKQHNKKIIVVLGYQTGWIFPDGNSRKYISAENIPHFVEFVERTVTRYKTKVDAWQVWNEPNFARFWKGTKAEYLELTKAASAKIKELDPDAMLLMGGFNLIGYNAYLKGLFKSGAMQIGGDFSFHPYNLNANWTTNCYKTLLKRLDKKNFTGNVVVTEVGYPTGGWYPNAISEKKLGSYIVKTMTLLAVNGVRVACWYQLFDPDKEKRAKRNSEDYFGLAFRNFEKKQGAAAYPACVKNIAGKTYDPSFYKKTKIPCGIKNFYFEGDDGSKTLIMWKKTFGTKKLKLSISGNEFMMFDVKTEKTISININEKLKITKSPVIITWR